MRLGPQDGLHRKRGKHAVRDLPRITILKKYGVMLIYYLLLRVLLIKVMVPLGNWFHFKST